MWALIEGFFWLLWEAFDFLLIDWLYGLIKRIVRRVHKKDSD